jgi:hypothetical protein
MGTWNIIGYVTSPYPNYTFVLCDSGSTYQYWQNGYNRKTTTFSEDSSPFGWKQTVYYDVNINHYMQQNCLGAGTSGSGTYTSTYQGTDGDAWLAAGSRDAACGSLKTQCFGEAAGGVSCLACYDYGFVQDQIVTKTTRLSNSVIGDCTGLVNSNVASGQSYILETVSDEIPLIWPSGWSPLPSEVCAGVEFEQTIQPINGTGFFMRRRPAIGTKSDSFGCTNPCASNYNPNASCDNGTCVGVIFGCTDYCSSNYNPNACSDDGSCAYDNGNCGGWGPAF